MKILLVANGYPPTAYGGVENYTADLAGSLRDAGHSVTVICAERRDDLPDRHVIEDEVEGVSVFRVVNVFKHLRSFSEIFADPDIEAVFEGLLDRIAPDVVHFNHLISLSARLPQIAAARGLPSLITLHDFWFICPRITLRDWQKQQCAGPCQGGDCLRCISTGTWWQQARTLTISTLRRIIPYKVRVALRNLLDPGDYFMPDLHPTQEALDRRYHLYREACLTAHQVLVPSHFVKDVFIRNGYPAEIFQVVPLGLEPPGEIARTKSPSKVLRVALIASLIPWKGVDALLRAFRAVDAPNLHLSLYGRADIAPAYVRRLRRIAAGDTRITFEGTFVPDQKDAVYRIVDLLVIPSLGYESFSLVAREALLRGTPVVASANGALPEIVSDGENGFLFEPGNVEALASILRRVAASPGLLTRLNLPGPFPIFTREEHVARITAYYRATIGEGWDG
jgi:glycosyltransferase involved in cell wall biosynthesis